MNALGRAIEHARIANQVYQDFINDAMNSGDKIDWWELNNLARRANEADSTLAALMKEVQGQPCTCNERTGSICAPCYADNFQRYGDDIPIGGK